MMYDYPQSDTLATMNPTRGNLDIAISCMICGEHKIVYRDSASIYSPYICDKCKRAVMSVRLDM